MSATQRTRRNQAKQRRLEEEKRRQLKALKKMRMEAEGRQLEMNFIAEEVHASYADYEEVVPGKKRKFLLGLLMLPVCMVSLLTFFDLLFRDTVEGAFWKSEGFWFFGCGCLCWLVMGWLHAQPTVLYVFAHEMTHAITARLSGGRIHSMKVRRDGGYVETDKTNTLITLSPYLVPFYTAVLFALYGVLCLFMDMQRELLIPLDAWDIRMKWVWVFYFLIGLTWCFHLTFTMKVLETEQSDLLHNGEFFSMMLIILINVIFLIILFIAASPTVGWADVSSDVMELLTSFWRGLTGWLI